MMQMFRWLLKPKFYSKCISYVNCIKTRLETIEKKRRAIQKFMKGDIAELLKRGLDYEAYKRTEGLLFEEKVLSCYEFVEKFIGCISDHLEDIVKQSDCPEECKEAIPSLMYAAARISGLPELRDLRTLFIEKYGNSLEPHINKEFVERLRRDPPTREMKIKLLYDIAQEFSIDWDAKALKKRLYTHPSLYEGRIKADGSGGEKKDESDFNISKENESRNQNSSDDETSTDTDRSSHHHGRKESSSSFGSISEEDDDGEQEVKEIKKPLLNSFWHIPPPYIKQQKINSNSYKTTDSEAIQKNIDSSGMKPTISVETSSPSSPKGNEQMWGGGWRAPSTLPDYDDFIARFKAFTGRS